MFTCIRSNGRTVPPAGRARISARRHIPQTASALQTRPVSSVAWAVRKAATNGAGTAADRSAGRQAPKARTARSAPHWRAEDRAPQQSATLFPDPVPLRRGPVKAGALREGAAAAGLAPPPLRKLRHRRVAWVHFPVGRLDRPARGARPNENSDSSPDGRERLSTNPRG